MPTHVCKTEQMPQRCCGPQGFSTWLFTEEKLGNEGRTVIWSQRTREWLHGGEPSTDFRRSRWLLREKYLLGTRA